MGFSDPDLVQAEPALVMSRRLYDQPMTTTSSVIDSVQKVSSARERVVRELGSLSEADCRYPAEWAGLQRNVNFLLRVFSLHELDHLQHLHKLLAARGRHFSEAQILLSKAQALRGELLALVLSLDEEEFNASGPGEGDWSIRQLIEHLADVDSRYAENIRRSVQAGRAAGA
jgi:hypothetical protein